MRRRPVSTVIATAAWAAAKGSIQVAPITGPFLFSVEDRPLALMDPRSPRLVTQVHKPYTADTLAQAIRKGVNSSGNPMNVLMPRYNLGQKEMKALTSYLKQLSTQLSPGVGEDTIRFATIIAPGVEPKLRDVMLEMMHGVFSQRNSSQKPRSGHMRMGAQLLPHTIMD